MNSQTQVRKGPVSAIRPIHVVAGIGGILFPILNYFALGFIFADIEHGSDKAELGRALQAFAFVALLPMVIALYTELKQGSRKLSALTALFGVLAIVAGIGGSTRIAENQATILIASASLGIWLGLAGFLAFQYGLLSRVWALLSLAVGGMALIAAAMVFLVDNYSASVSLIVAIPLWTVWTGILLIRRARV